MSDVEQEVERPGIDRRTLIKRTAAAGAVAWAAPTIIGSLASPAGAVTGGGFPCSYVSLVVQLANQSIVAVKVNINATACSLDNTTSGDAQFTNVSCGGATYSNNCNGTAICRNGTAVPAAASCPVTVSGGTVTATGGATILFAIVHDGSCSGGPATHFCTPTCGPTNSILAPANCSGT